MDLIEGILTRHSVRNYDVNKKATTEQIEQILRCAMQAPSAMNKQPWHFVVVTDGATLSAIQNVHPYAGFLEQAGTAIVVVADSENCWEEYWKVDPMLAGQNILLSAHALGLSTCWCGVYPNEQHMENLRHILNIPSNHKPIALIALGTANSSEKHHVASRFNPQRVHRNEW